MVRVQQGDAALAAGVGSDVLPEEGREAAGGEDVAISGEAEEEMGGSAVRFGQADGQSGEGGVAVDGEAHLCWGDEGGGGDVDAGYVDGCVRGEAGAEDAEGVGEEDVFDVDFGWRQRLAGLDGEGERVLANALPGKCAEGDGGRGGGGENGHENGGNGHAGEAADAAGGGGEANGGAAAVDFGDTGDVAGGAEDGDAGDVAEVPRVEIDSEVPGCDGEGFGEGEAELGEGAGTGGEVEEAEFSGGEGGGEQDRAEEIGEGSHEEWTFVELDGANFDSITIRCLTRECRHR